MGAVTGLYDPDAVTDRGKRPMYADDRQSGTIYCTSRATSRSHGVVTATGIYTPPRRHGDASVGMNTE
jgi:hypothetical protein